MLMTTAEYMRLDRIASQLEDAHDVTGSTGSQETKHALLTGAQELRELMRESSLFPAKETEADAVQSMLASLSRNHAFREFSAVR